MMHQRYHIRAGQIRLNIGLCENISMRGKFVHADSYVRQPSPPKDSDLLVPLPQEDVTELMC